MAFSTRNHISVALLSLCNLAAQGQTTPPVSPPATTATAPVPDAGMSLKAPIEVTGKYREYLTKRYATDKEARAVVHMFGRKQTGGGLWLAGGAGFIAFVTTQTGTTTSSSGTRTTTVTPLGYVIMTGVFGGIGINKLTRFGNQNLYKALLEYDQVHTFPSRITGKLAAKDYR